MSADRRPVLYVDRLRAAVSAIRERKLSFRAAAAKFEIPLSSLHSASVFWKGKPIESIKLRKKGPKTLLPIEAEQILADKARRLDHWGVAMPLRRAATYAREILEHLGMGTADELENMVTTGWLRRFRKRNGLKASYAQRYPKGRRGALPPEVVQEFVAKLQDAGINDVAACNIWNMDETTIGFGAARTKHLHDKHNRAPKRLDTEPAHVKLIFAGNALGNVTIPVSAVARGLAVDADTVREASELGMQYFSCSSGALDRDLFSQWIRDVFMPNVPGISARRKQILILDNDSSHHAEEALRELEATGFSIVFLPPKATDVLQPYDRTFFRPWKQQLGKELAHFEEHHMVSNRNPTLLETLQIVKKITSALPVARLLQSGFKACGIVPLDPERMVAPLAAGVTKAARHPALPTPDQIRKIAEEVVETDEEDIAVQGKRKRGRPHTWQYVTKGRVDDDTIQRLGKKIPLASMPRSSESKKRRRGGAGAEQCGPRPSPAPLKGPRRAPLPSVCGPLTVLRGALPELAGKRRAASKTRESHPDEEWLPAVSSSASASTSGKRGTNRYTMRRRAGNEATSGE